MGQQLLIVLASIMAGVGMAGIPEAGLIVLPLVLRLGGPSEPWSPPPSRWCMPVDWILARARSGVNVMSDMLVAILLHELESKQVSDDPTSVAAKSSML